MAGGHTGELPEREGHARTPGMAGLARTLLEAMFNEAPVGIALLDPELFVVCANAELGRIAGRPVEHMRGVPVWEALPGVFGRRFDAGTRTVLSGNAAVTDVHLVVGEGDARVHLSLSCYPVHEHGLLVGVGVTLADVTARFRGQELTERLLAVAGHDLKTPIAAINLSAQALLRAVVGERQQRLVRGIASSASRIEGIMRDLVDYAVAHRGKGIPIRPVLARLDALCRVVADECQAATPDRVVECEGDEGMEGEWDPDRLAQAISNLVTNALKYGDPAVPVALRWYAGQGEALVEVKNAGTPIPPDVLPGLFAPFRRGPGEQRARGLGLGLYIAREIAVAHGGRLVARSSAEEGTVFTLAVPFHAQ